MRNAIYTINLIGSRRSNISQYLLKFNPATALILPHYTNPLILFILLLPHSIKRQTLLARIHQGIAMKKNTRNLPNRRSYLFGITGLAFLISCAPTQFLKASYVPAQLENKSLLVYPLNASQIKVTCDDDFKDDFESVTIGSSEFFQSELNNLAQKYFDQNFKKIKVLESSDSLFTKLTPENSFKVQEKIGDAPFEMRIPTLEYLAKSKSNTNPKFILVLDQVVFSRNTTTFQNNFGSTPASAAPLPGQIVTFSPSSSMMSTTSTSKSISMGLNYLIYDYEQKATVSYGFVSGEKSFQFVLTHDDWYKAIHDAFSKIKKFSPANF